jgi:hypothetical protein
MHSDASSPAHGAPTVQYSKAERRSGHLEARVEAPGVCHAQPMTAELNDSDRALLDEAAESPAHRWSLRKVGRLEGDDEAGDDLDDHELLAQAADTYGDIAFDEAGREGSSPKALEDSRWASLSREILAASAALTARHGSPDSRRAAAQSLLIFSRDDLPPE